MLNAKNTRTESIGRNVAAIRRRRGLTLDGLSALSSVSRASISALENGADNPRIQTLWNLADALGVNFGTLMDNCEDECVLEDDGVNIQLIDRQTSPKIVEAYLMELPVGITRSATPHATGVYEHVIVLSGEMLTGPSDNPHLLTPGQSVSFAADSVHIYSAHSATRAIVTVVYPSPDTDIQPDQEFKWPQNEVDWQTLVSLLARTTIEVQNGLNVDIKTFHLPEQMSIEKAATELQKNVSDLPTCPAVQCFIFANKTLGILSLYRTPPMCALSRNHIPLSDEHANRCFELAYQATARLGYCDLDTVHRSFREASSMIESALAAEILTRNKIPTVPLGVEEKKCSRKTDIDASHQLFEARIDVDAYQAYEFVHPAYARQTLALASYLPATEGLRILDIGTGPGLPLAMLREIRPDLRALAVDPSEFAIEHLTQRFAEVPAVEIRKTSIVDLELEPLPFEAAVSIGASHHLDTSQFLSSARNQLCENGIFLVADEMICSFSNRKEREKSLIRHHLWYILDTLVEIPNEADSGDKLLAKRLAQILPAAMGMAYSGQVDAARSTIRNLYEEVIEIEKPMNPSHSRAVFSRFHLLELRALIAGIDYEVEQKTSPARFKALAHANGFEVKNHHRIYATEGDKREDAGTHLFVLEAV